MRQAFAVLIALLAGASAVAEDSKLQARPFDLSATRDESRAVTVKIEAEDGGEIRAENEYGDVITLTIAPNTLYYDEAITLVPLSTLTGIDGAERTIGVAMEPSGTRFSAPARLTITPKVPLMGELWWFESPKSQANQAKPGMAMPKLSGMYVWHFSTAAAASGSGLSSAVSARAPDPPAGGFVSSRVSLEWLDWRRNQTIQDYEAGRIDSIKRDADLTAITDLEAQIYREQAEAAERRAQAELEKIYKEVDDARDPGMEGAEAALEEAKAGDPDSIDSLAGAIGDLLGPERTAQLLGLPTRPERQAKAFAIIETFRDAVRTKCEQQRDLGQETAQFLISLERNAELFGMEPEADQSLLACMLREWSGAETANYATFSVRKAECTQGNFGKYAVTWTGDIEAAFEVTLSPPKDNWITTTVQTYKTSAVSYDKKRWACEAKGEFSVVQPPGAFFQLVTAGDVTCTPPAGYHSDPPSQTRFGATVKLNSGPLCRP